MMNSLLTMILLLLMFALSIHALDTKRVVFVIISQENSYHNQLANSLKNDIQKQAEQLLYQEPPVVHFTHQDFPHVGHWTILPILTKLTNLHQSNSSWIFFMEDRTKIRLNILLDVLNKYDSTREIWLGHALTDKEATIIHHFSFYEDPEYFKYPNIASGFAMSIPLIKRLSDRIKHSTPSSDFSIDNSHELALFVWNKGVGEMLQHESALCIREKPHCATVPTPFQLCLEDVVPKSSIYFAVKTCQKYHQERVPVVKNTWGKHAEYLYFFSDVKDENIPTISLGVPNTEQGHCGKTIAILRYVAKQIKNYPEIKWIVVTDDDTILSVLRMQQLLTCYDNTDLLALGERYGYNVYNTRGYNYITGGGGIVFSRPLLNKLTENGVCECPSINTPDDMYLGICIARLGVPITHSPLFHQARPVDYAPGYLVTEDAVSFHKHWMIDPVTVYKKWFGDAGGDAFTTIELHNEL